MNPPTGQPPTFGPGDDAWSSTPRDTPTTGDLATVEPLMQLQGVRFAYQRDQPVLADLDVTVAPGRLHVVIGPNAAGKSTLLRLMLGQLAPTEGRVLLDGRPVRRLRARRRAAVLSYVPQRSIVGFAYTVRQMVTMGRFALPPDRAAINRAIDRCDLLSIADRPYHELSVGQQQRVMLARALAQSAGQGRVMLLDEPTSAMDPAHVHRVMAILRELVDGGLAVVAVVHDLNLAARYADDVWLLHDGIFAATGPWSDVLTPEVLEPVYDVQLDVLQRLADPGDPLARRPLFDPRLPDTFNAG